MCETHQDLRGLSHFLDRHLTEIAERIPRSAEAAHCTSILEREVIRSHATGVIPKGIQPKTHWKPMADNPTGWQGPPKP